MDISNPNRHSTDIHHALFSHGGEISGMGWASGRSEVRGGLDFAKTRGWKAAPRADCSRREENNANNGRDVALRWAQAYAANTITLWTRLPFKWKQTWNAKIQRRVCPRNARNRASIPLSLPPPRSSVCKLCTSIVYRMFHSYRKIFHARILWWKLTILSFVYEHYFSQTIIYRDIII